MNVADTKAKHDDTVFVRSTKHNVAYPRRKTQIIWCTNYICHTAIIFTYMKNILLQ